ncbi:MAG: hypothetical protein WCP06_04515 [Verrucomicrobiota bacterium]
MEILTYTIRVELHGSDIPEKTYEALNSALDQVGFKRTISTNGVEVNLPKGEYWCTSDQETNIITTAAVNTVQSVWPHCSVLVSKTIGEWGCYGLVPA